jgi:MtN3 and saliva related transmembrane protein
MDIYELCGYSAGILFASSLIPQVYKSFKTKELNDISIIWQLIFILALVLGIIYSYHNNLKPIYICSFIELILMIILLF